MMKLRTELFLSPSETKITYPDPVYFSGSCFSEHIASKMEYHGFNVCSNSHGIVYNPVSIKHSFMDLVLQKTYTTKDLEEAHGRHFSYAHHGSFSSRAESKILEKINSSLTRNTGHLAQSTFVLITLGSAWVYEKTGTNKVVANCHKQPASLFDKRLLSAEEVVDCLEAIIALVGSVTSAQVIFTLSPVKHLKDGFVENQHSKSILHSAIQKVLKTGVSYFPAYEIMLDDLRDYRFWSEDMVHPSNLAIQYIWEKFSGVYFHTPTIEIMKEVHAFRQLMNHRSLSSDPDEIEALAKRKQETYQQLATKYPQLKIEYEG